MAKQLEKKAPTKKEVIAKNNKSVIEMLVEIQKELSESLGWRQKKAIKLIDNAIKILPTDPNDIN